VEKIRYLNQEALLVYSGVGLAIGEGAGHEQPPNPSRRVDPCPRAPGLGLKNHTARENYPF
jgi:hypothetical protein